MWAELKKEIEEKKNHYRNEKEERINTVKKTEGAFRDLKKFLKK